jgi:MerR family copper efflux transcriptional regulator
LATFAPTERRPSPYRSRVVIDEHYQIGEVADNVGLSLRTIRYYEEIGLVKPSGRTEGGFRLYTKPDVDRLRLAKALKPVGMSLETLGELLEAADHVADSSDIDRPEAESRLEAVLAVAMERCDQLEERLVEARRALKELAVFPVRGGR